MTPKDSNFGLEGRYGFFYPQCPEVFEDNLNLYFRLEGTFDMFRRLGAQLFFLVRCTFCSRKSPPEVDEIWNCPIS